MIQETQDILDNIEMHLIDTFDRRERAMEILKLFIEKEEVVKENELLHSVILSDSEISKYIEDKNDVFDECPELDAYKGGFIDGAKWHRDGCKIE